MEHFREVQDGIFLLKSPFPPVWSGVTLVRGEELCLIDSGASADVVDGVIRPALAELGLGLGDIDWLVSTHCHGDHIGGHARIKELAPQIRTACIEQAAPALRDPAANAVRIRTKYPRLQPAAPVLSARCGAGSCSPGRGGAGGQTYGAAHPGT